MIKDVKMMAKKILYVILAGVLMLFSSCAEDLVGESVQPTEKHFGEEILFGGSASYNVNGGTKNGTRTVYGGYENIEDGTEPVYWTQGDAVRVYCPEGANNTADYDVDVAGEKVITTSLSRRGESALQWGNPNNKHTFYGVYPIPVDNSLVNNSVINGEIPSQQTGVYEKKTYTHVFHPNMQHAYMVAKTVVKNPNAIGSNVYMKFMPIATAVEISLQNNSGRQLSISSVTCYSEQVNIAGSFTADLSSLNTDDTNNVSYGKDGLVAENQEGTLHSKITYSTQINNQAVSLSIGESIVFTVFMLPTASVEDLNILIEAKTGDIPGYKRGKLEGVTIKKQQKTFLRNLSLSSKPYTESEWIKYTDDDKALNALSIPGAGGAASGDTNHDKKWDLPDASRQQNLCISDLWHSGIRCFEFPTDIYTVDEEGKNTTTITSDLGTQDIICNGISCGITLDDAIDDIVTELADAPNEFAMVILTYQTLGGWDQRSPKKYAELLDTYWNTVANKLKTPCSLGTYAPNMTIKDARGKLFCIARPTSIYQDYGTVASFGTNTWWDWSNIESVDTKNIDFSEVSYTFKNTNIVQIHGWGALKDKWQQRGYATGRLGTGPNTNRPFDVSTLWSVSNLTTHNNMPSHKDWNVPAKAKYDKTKTIDTWYGNLPNNTWTCAKLTPDFKYETSIDGVSAWVQEYARVSNMGNSIADIMAIEQKKCSQSNIIHGSRNPHDEVKAIYWANTKQEKIDNIKSCLEYALQNNTNTTIYVNSLCGYYIDKTFYESYMPCILTDWNTSNGKVLSVASKTAGMQGNIGTFAKDMNEEFYKILSDKTKNGPLDGCMGLIMMDRVGESEASKRIPQIIIANNFKFELNTDIEIPEGGEIKQGDEILSRKNTRSIELPEQPTIIWE